MNPRLLPGYLCLLLAAFCLTNCQTQSGPGASGYDPQKAKDALRGLEELGKLAKDAQRESAREDARLAHGKTAPYHGNAAALPQSAAVCRLLASTVATKKTVVVWKGSNGAMPSEVSAYTARYSNIRMTPGGVLCLRETDSNSAQGLKDITPAKNLPPRITDMEIPVAAMAPLKDSDIDTESEWKPDGMATQKLITRFVLVLNRSSSKGAAVTTKSDGLTTHTESAILLFPNRAAAKQFIQAWNALHAALFAPHS